MVKAHIYDKEKEEFSLDCKCKNRIKYKIVDKEKPKYKPGQLAKMNHDEISDFFEEHTIFNQIECPKCNGKIKMCIFKWCKIILV